jgi:hypothetical protein
MWTERPRAFTDGLVVVTVVSLVMCAALGLVSHVPPKQACQEVVVDVESSKHILAQCPAGTWVDIVDDNVVCRCGTRREPVPVEQVPPAPTFVFPHPRSLPDPNVLPRPNPEI